MASYLTTTGEFDLSAIMVGAWRESEIARRILGKSNHPAIVAARRERFSTFLKRVWSDAKYQKRLFDIEAARVAAEAARREAVRAAIPADQRAARVAGLREALTMNDYSDSRDYFARRAAIISEISLLVA
jgi:hypothetical protein